MKRTKDTVILILFIAFIIGLIYLFFKFEIYYFFIKEPLPESESGIWYNDELHMEIDFKHLHSTGGDCVTVYNSEDRKEKTPYSFGTHATGNEVTIRPFTEDGLIDGMNYYITGTYKYSDEKFIFTAYNGTVYIFEKIKEKT